MPSPPYQLKHVRFVVDDTLRFEGETGFQMWLPPLPHKLQLFADYGVRDSARTFGKAAAFELKAIHGVTSVQGHTVELTARARPRGDATTPPERSAEFVWSVAVK